MLITFLGAHLFALLPQPRGTYLLTYFMLLAQQSSAEFARRLLRKQRETYSLSFYRIEHTF